MIISNLIGIIADDLTGANDTALQFHLRGSNTQILLDYEAYLQNIKNAQTWAISTETRNVTSDIAYKKVKAATQVLVDKLNLEFFYKKIDSTLRGNIAVETLAMLEVLNWDAAVIIPAFPSEGRITVGGYHLLKGVPIERTELARDVHSPIFESHVPTLLKSQLDDNKKDIVGLIDLSTIMNGAGPILLRINELISQGKKLIVADSVSITDIEQVVLAINKSDYNILPTGASACAQVLGNIWLPEMKNQHVPKTIPELPKLIVSGSATLTTEAQIKKLSDSDDFNNTYFINLDLKTVVSGMNEEFSNRVLNNLGQNNIVVVNTSNLATSADVTTIASVALFSLIAIALQPASEQISLGGPIIIPPDSSPAKRSLGFIPRSILLPKISFIIIGFVGFFSNLSSTFFIILAISLNPTGTLITFTLFLSAHSSHESEDAVVLIIKRGYSSLMPSAFNCFNRKSINIKNA